MSWELISVVVSIVSAAILAAAAIAAVIQIRHLRAGNQLEGFLAISRELDSPELLHARAFVELELSKKLADNSYREELLSGRIDLTQHPEIRIGNFWEKMGALIRHGVLEAPIFYDFFAHRCVGRWRDLLPVVELVRQNDPLMWGDFQYIAARCQEYLNQRHRGGSW
jgi:hypothetical protein